MIFIIVVLLLILDQSTKLLISAGLTLNNSIPVIKNIFHLTLIHNKGGAFGIFKNYTGLFIFTAFVAILFVIINLKAKKSAYKSRVTRIALSLILSGALGNLIDRIRLGYVIDFLDFRVWPVFNLADSAITIGAILLAYSILFRKNASYNL